MIFNLFFNFIFLIVGSLFVFLPVVTISSIPVVGGFVYSSLSNAIAYFNTFLLLFPYGQIVWSLFLNVVLPIEIMILVMRFFFGHRLPVNMN